ncbi:hypothetical protein [Nocardia ninae]|uniref:Uncharacterized protein n=1 Tax=Nocardia ninae NBRC 108245 TaxID=1210091 RepID=A0A511MEE0_9NOCA|nr:hypothetical protein [Nocardia ninae]GEM38507.1 hypothetical protein NN4_30260 [Nocardia ninae NBRC 108245]
MLVVGAQSALQDVAGGVDCGQWMLVLAQTRYLVLICCQARGLEFGAEPYVAEDGGALDPYTHVPPDVWQGGQHLLHQAEEFSRTAPEPAEAQAWLEQVRTWVSGVESSFGLPDFLPELRSPEGMFGAIRLVRAWDELINPLQLPALLPSDWTRPL